MIPYLRNSFILEIYNLYSHDMIFNLTLERQLFYYKASSRPSAVLLYFTLDTLQILQLYTLRVCVPALIILILLSYL